MVLVKIPALLITHLGLSDAEIHQLLRVAT